MIWLTFDLYEARIRRFGVKISPQIELLLALLSSQAVRVGEGSPEALDLSAQFRPKVDLHRPRILRFGSNSFGQKLTSAALEFLDLGQTSWCSRRKPLGREGVLENACLGSFLTSTALESVDLE